MDAAVAPTLTLYPLSNYSFAVKEPQLEQDPTVTARLVRLENEFDQGGIRRTVEGVLVVHDHGHPNVLLLQVANAFFKLPGDYLKPNEPDLLGLQSRLHLRLGPADSHLHSDVEEEGVNEAGIPEGAKEWEIKECLAQFWRPNFEGFMYPYVPAHITKPKEVKSLYLVQLPPHKVLTVPKNMKILAIPLFELYDNSVRYGPQLASLPHLLSKYQFNLA